MEIKAAEFATSFDAAAEKALEAINVVGKANRWRRLTVICPANHRLVTVYETTMGPIGVSFKRVTRLSHARPGDEERDGIVVHETHSAREQRHFSVLALLETAPLQGIDPDCYRVPADCECRSVDIPLLWLGDQVGAGRMRVVFDYSA
jgi:hypothetical protein